MLHNGEQRRAGHYPCFPNSKRHWFVPNCLFQTGLFPYSLYLHAAFLFPEVYHFPVLLYSTVFTSMLEDKPGTEVTRVLYKGQEFVRIIYHRYTLEYSLPCGCIWQPVLPNKKE